MGPNFVRLGVFPSFLREKKKKSRKGTQICMILVGSLKKFFCLVKGNINVHYQQNIPIPYLGSFLIVYLDMFEASIDLYFVNSLVVFYKQNYALCECSL